MKDITFFKYWFRNGVIPLGIISLITVPFCIVGLYHGDKDGIGWLIALTILWILVTGFNYILWKNNISDLGAALKKLFKKK